MFAALRLRNLLDVASLSTLFALIGLSQAVWITCDKDKMALAIKELVFAERFCCERPVGGGKSLQWSKDAVEIIISKVGRIHKFLYCTKILRFYALS